MVRYWVMRVVIEVKLTTPEKVSVLYCCHHSSVTVSCTTKQQTDVTAGSLVVAALLRFEFVDIAGFRQSRQSYVEDILGEMVTAAMMGRTPISPKVEYSFSKYIVAAMMSENGY